MPIFRIHQNKFIMTNWLALIVAAISALVVGFVWYNPKVFGTAWMKEVGMTEEEFAKLMGENPVSQEEIQILENHLRDTTKRYWVDRAAMKQRGGRRAPLQDPRTGKFMSRHESPNRADIERAKEAKDPETVINELLPDNDPIFS